MKKNSSKRLIVGLFMFGGLVGFINAAHARGFNFDCWSARGATWVNVNGAFDHKGPHALGVLKFRALISRNGAQSKQFFVSGEGKSWSGGTVEYWALLNGVSSILASFDISPSFQSSFIDIGTERIPLRCSGKVSQESGGGSRPPSRPPHCHPLTTC